MSAFVPPIDQSIGFALLAAGQSERFGGGKLEALLDDKPLWRWAADAGEEAGFVSRFLIVSGQPALDAKGWTVVVNPDAEDGIATSIAMACSLARDCERLVIALADMPFIEPGHLRALASAEGVAFTSYPSGREGVPAGFPRTSFVRLSGMKGDQGAAALEWVGRTKIAPASPESLIDIDTPDDLYRIRSMFAARRT